MYQIYRIARVYLKRALHNRYNGHVRLKHAV